MEVLTTLARVLADIATDPAQKSGLNLWVILLIVVVVVATVVFLLRKKKTQPEEKQEPKQ